MGGCSDWTAGMFNGRTQCDWTADMFSGRIPDWVAANGQVEYLDSGYVWCEDALIGQRLRGFILIGQWVVGG